MNMHKPEVVASIDVGSNSLQMIIAEIDAAGKVSILEDLWKPTDIGRDTFAHKRISVESINETTDTLKGFVKIMKDYHALRYRAVSTSGLREADNREYVLEQLRLRTGLSVEVINSSQERLYIYKSMRDRLPAIQDFRYPGFLIVNIRMGGMEASVYYDGFLNFTEYIKAGSLRLRQVLKELEEMTLDFPAIMEEYLESKIYSLQPRIRALNMVNVVGLGGEIDTIAELCKQMKIIKTENFISKKALNRLFIFLREMTTEQIAFEYDLHHNEADIILPSIIIFRKFLEMTKAEGIHVPGVTLRHGLLADMVDEKFDTSRKQLFNEDIISSVWYLGKKHGAEAEHTRQVTELALSIFDQSQHIHRLNSRDRMLLEVASILHDVGQSIDASEYAMHSYNIIMAADIMGFSDREMQLIANIARYHSEDIPQPGHRNYYNLMEVDKITVSKLAAMLKLAAALDITLKHKVRQIDISRSKRELIFTIDTGADTLLEEWSFSQHSGFFEEVMGYRPRLKKKGTANG
ncbi:MAG: HD domain-containing protein [Syntrophomonadaceae bacterium]|nr:HD domain-containing protein [Syntrophomonadaceae bacterium]